MKCERGLRSSSAQSRPLWTVLLVIRGLKISISSHCTPRLSRGGAAPIIAPAHFTSFFHPTLSRLAFTLSLHFSTGLYATLNSAYRLLQLYHDHQASSIHSFCASILPSAIPFSTPAAAIHGSPCIHPLGRCLNLLDPRVRVPICWLIRLMTTYFEFWIRSMDGGAFPSSFERSEIQRRRVELLQCRVVIGLGTPPQSQRCVW